ncbi:hypothetical protein LPJ38_03155 [Bradyrhizobium daqingense]|uniref:Uncharacterized protein n=1 Tax=Bradyrhizobium daqingense TaxID=993502 RepID=A0A562LJW4_9BRAD|nr:hypothetical protein [Bradyrhizobium daqingense]TWI07883.1 hypothetical protein IQ17_02240 [Bradyrhizobium daqingense]UFS89803.1 hypothetical protein LPJ38_03155 [Bradyrhizobium daqingense]
MSKSTSPVNGGAMPSATLTIANLTDEQTGRLNRDVYQALVRREAMRTFGSTAPRYLRQAAKLYRDHVAQQLTAWRQRHGLAVSTSLVSAYGRPQQGVRRSTF